MKGLKNKLSSNRGASILIAIGLFLICAMISSVIVVAAASGSSRNIKRVEQQRSYLSMSSAAQIMMEDLAGIQGKKYLGQEQRVVCGCQKHTKLQEFADYDNEPGYAVGNHEDKQSINLKVKDYWGSYNYDDVYEPMIKKDSKCTLDTWKEVNFREIIGDYENILVKDLEDPTIEDIMIEAAGEIRSGRKTEYNKSFLIDVSDAKNRISDVKGVFIMDSNYNVTVELTMDNSSYAVTIKMPVKEKVVPGDNDYTELTDQAVEAAHEGWYKLEFFGNWVRREGAIMFNRVPQYRNTTVEWGVPTLTKGVEPHDS